MIWYACCCAVICCEWRWWSGWATSSKNRTSSSTRCHTTPTPVTLSRWKSASRTACTLSLSTTSQSKSSLVCMLRTMLLQHACQSACLSHAGTVSKQLNISWDFFHHWVATAFWFFRTKRYDYIPTGTPVIRTFSAGGGKNCDFRPMSRFILEMIQES